MKKTYIITLAFLALILSGCALNTTPMDSDHDGVRDSIDVCKSTPKLSMVDKYGCSLDDDKDGVINIYDQCPNTPSLDKVGRNGCSIK